MRSFLAKEIPNIGITVVQYRHAREPTLQVLFEKHVDLFKDFFECRRSVDLCLCDACESRAESSQCRTQCRSHEGVERVDDFFLFQVNDDYREFNDFLNRQSLGFIACAFEVDDK